MTLTICSSSQAIREMLHTYAEQLAANSELDLWLLYDTGSELNMTNVNAVLTFQKQHPSVGVFFYNRAAYTVVFPAATALASADVNWMLHDASAALWVHKCFYKTFSAGPVPPEDGKAYASFLHESV